MSRYIAPSPQKVAIAHSGGNGDLQQYLDRVVAYIPAEVTALYAAGIGAASAETSGSWRIGLESLVLVVAFLFAGFPLYGKGTEEEKGNRRIQIAIAMVAFLAWAYALNTGIVAEFKIYHTAIALVVLFAVTTVAGRYKPMKPADPPRDPHAAEAPPAPVEHR